MPGLLLLRHGQSTWNAEQRWQGRADPPLSAQGETQAAHAASRLAAWRFERVVSSDQLRAMRTAELIADALGIDAIEPEPGLRERDVGEWTGLTALEVGARWPEELAAWRERRMTTPPGGEVDFTGRVVPVVETLARAVPANGAHLAITHGGVIHAVERHIGAEPCRAANLCGRWVEWRDGALAPGDLLVISVDEEPATL